MPLAVVPLLALTGLLSTTPAPQFSMTRIPTSYSPQQHSSYSPDSSLLHHLPPETRSKAYAKETTTMSTESASGSAEPQSSASRLAALISALPSLSNDAPDGKRTLLFPVTAVRPAILHDTTNHSELTPAGKEEELASDMDGIDEESGIRSPSEREEAEERMPPFRSFSLPNFAAPLSFSDFLHRYVTATEAAPSAAGVMSLHQPTSPRPSGRKHFASESSTERVPASPIKSIFSALFGETGAPAAITLFPNAFTSIRTKRPTAAPRPVTIADMLARWKNSAQNSVEKSTPKPSEASYKSNSSREESISQDSQAVKNYFLHNTMLLLQRLYSDSRNSSLQVPLQDIHAYDGFGLEADDYRHSFPYQFLKNVFSEGVGGVRRVTSLHEDMMALTQRLLNPANVLSIITPLYGAMNGHPGSRNKQAPDLQDQVHVHDAFESNFDFMNEEKWFETPEFIVSTAVISVIILLVIIALILSWNNTRKSNSFPVSLHQMNYEEAPKSQILYI